MDNGENPCFALISESVSGTQHTGVVDVDPHIGVYDDVLWRHVGLHRRRARSAARLPRDAPVKLYAARCTLCNRLQYLLVRWYMVGDRHILYA